MSITPNAEKDRTADLTDIVTPSMPWRVAAVSALPGYRLLVRFIDGTSGTVDMAAMIAGPDAGVFAALRDAEFFGRVDVVLGAVTWPGELDLAPDAMYDAIQARGEWVLR